MAACVCTCAAGGVRRLRRGVFARRSEGAPRHARAARARHGRRPLVAEATSGAHSRRRHHRHAGRRSALRAGFRVGSGAADRPAHQPGALLRTSASVGQGRKEDHGGTRPGCSSRAARPPPGARRVRVVSCPGGGRGAAGRARRCGVAPVRDPADSHGQQAVLSACVRVPAPVDGDAGCCPPAQLRIVSSLTEQQLVAMVQPQPVSEPARPLTLSRLLCSRTSAGTLALTKPLLRGRLPRSVPTPYPA
jgi:hypothetical protein